VNETHWSGPERDRRLVATVMHNLHRISICGDPMAHPRWYVASEVFAIGSTSAVKLCEEFGLDPDATIGGFDPDEEDCP
jgi:hypothetical protein